MTNSTVTQTVETAPTDPRPHVRWGAIVWGLIVIAAAGVTLFVLGAHERTVAFADWLGRVTVGEAWLVGVLAVGGVILLLGLLALLRRTRR